MGGWRIVKTMGQHISRLRPVDGFCAESGAALTLALTTIFRGIPVSTTHTITGAIVGVGALKRWSAVRWGVAGRVVWAGMLAGPAKWGAFRAAEALVLPSHQENFGIVVAEALSCGTPVLLSDQVNIASDVQRCGAGLVEADTVAGTERLLLRWSILTEAQRANMAQQAVACWRPCLSLMVKRSYDCQSSPRSTTGRVSRAG